jgi:hypothetical protein
LHSLVIVVIALHRCTERPRAILFHGFQICVSDFH